MTVPLIFHRKAGQAALQFPLMDANDSLQVQNAPGGALPNAAESRIDANQLEYSLVLTPLERLIQHDQALELVLAVRQAGIRHYGFDPRLPEDSERP